MTEKQAWIYLAECWEASPSSIFDDVVFVKVSEGENTCLCASIARLEDLGDLSRLIGRTMINKIPKPVGSLYAWPRDLEGKKQRAEFCRKMANQAA